MDSRDGRVFVPAQSPDTAKRANASDDRAGRQEGSKIPLGAFLSFSYRLFGGQIEDSIPGRRTQSPGPAEKIVDATGQTMEAHNASPADAVA
jgi:hypothetical protein